MRQYDGGLIREDRHTALSDTVGHPGGHKVRTLESVVIRFAGDSGDGMQVTGDRFTAESAVFGNDLATLPDFPAEIRAPPARCPGCPPSRCRSPPTTS